MSVPEPIRRVLLALDAVAQDAEPFEAASMLAVRLGDELEALFVEDINLARLAALIFRRRSSSNRPCRELARSCTHRRRAKRPSVSFAGPVRG